MRVKWNGLVDAALTSAVLLVVTAVAQKSIRTQKQALPKGERESVDPTTANVRAGTKANLFQQNQALKLILTEGEQPMPKLTPEHPALNSERVNCFACGATLLKDEARKIGSRNYGTRKYFCDEECVDRAREAEPEETPEDSPNLNDTMFNHADPRNR